MNFESTLAPTTVKVQHVVPRVLQAQFTSEGLMHALNLDTGECHRSSTKNTGAEARFYDVEMAGARVSSESWLSRIESAFGAVLKRLVNDPTAVTGLSPDEEVALAMFVCVQDFRNHAQRDLEARHRRQRADHARAITKAAMKRDLGDENGTLVYDLWYGDEPEGFWLGEDEPYQPGLATAQILAQASTFAGVLLKMPWKVGIVPSSLNLYLSDNGVSRVSTPRARWAVFFERAYYLPLAPRTLLRIGPGLASDAKSHRRVVAFSGWEAVYANYAASQGTERTLFGDGPFFDRNGRVIHGTCSH
jgi:hypothetical protein